MSAAIHTGVFPGILSASGVLSGESRQGKTASFAQIITNYQPSWFFHRQVVVGILVFTTLFINFCTLQVLGEASALTTLAVYSTLGCFISCLPLSQLLPHVGLGGLRSHLPGKWHLLSACPACESMQKYALCCIGAFMAPAKRAERGRKPSPVARFG